MRCPNCDATENHVVDTRDSRGGKAVRRRRECGVCHARFTTYEHLEERPLQVLKRDGSSETFDRAKIVQSLHVACTKRPVSGSQIEDMVDGIHDALSGGASLEIVSSRIGELVMEALEPVDRVAYVRYASVYRNFQDIGEFQEVVDSLNVREARQVRAKQQKELPF